MADTNTETLTFTIESLTFTIESIKDDIAAAEANVEILDGPAAIGNNLQIRMDRDYLKLVEGDLRRLKRAA